MATTVGGTVGYEILVELGIAVGAGPVKIRAAKPSGAVLWTATIEDADSGLISYTTVAGDLDEAGTYILRGVYDPAGDNVFYGDPVELVVEAL